MRAYWHIIVLTLTAFVFLSLPAHSDVTLPNGGWDPAWSPDGNSIAFTSGSPHSIPNLWLIRADKTGLRQMTTRGAHEPEWLPDGKTIVFGTLRRGRPIFMAIQADGEPGSEKPIDVLPIGAEGPIWSPNGSLVSYGTESKDGKSRDLVIARTGGGGSTALTSNFWCREWTWSPDGSKIAFVVGRSTGTSIWTVNVAAKDVKLLYKGFCSAPSYSPDGKRLALAVPDVRSGFKIVVIDLGSGLDKKIGVRTFNGQKLTWSRDGKQLYFESSRKSEPAIWSVGVDGTNIVRITSQGMPSTSFALSPDGTRFVYQMTTPDSYSPELAVCTTTGGMLTKLTTTSSPSYWAPVWAPGGRQFALQTDVKHAAEVRVGSPSGSLGKAITQVFGSDPAEVSWFSDGTRLLVADTGRLLIANPAGGKDAAKPLPKLASQVESPRLQGTEVIVTEWGLRDASLSAFRLDGSGRRQLTQKPEAQPAPKPQKSDGQKPSNQKVATPVKVSSADISARILAGAGPAPTADAEEGNPHSGLGLMGPQANVTGDQRPPMIDLWPAVSPDRKSLAFLRNDQVWLANIDGSGERQVTELQAQEGAKRSVSSLSWSPKGDSLLFLALDSASDGLTMELWSCGTQAGSQRLVYSEKVDTEYGVFYSGCTSPPVPMAGGTRTLFTSISSGEPRIVSIASDGSDLREIAPAPSSFPALDSTGKKLAYVDLSNSRERIRVLDLATGKRTGALFQK